MRALVVLSLVAGLPAFAPLAFAASEEPGAPPDREEIVLEARPAVPAAPPIAESIFRRGASGYRIGRQDLLEIDVFGVEELKQTVRVSDDGSITLPLLGRLAVAGLTKAELEGLIARLLDERYVRDPQVTVFVKEYESRKVAVSGAVKKPDTYEMLGDKTLLEMISIAGGLDKDLGKEIVIFRQDDHGTTRRIAVDLERLVYDADPSLNLAVLPGDIIYVPAVEKIRIFVTGAVKSPNLYEVPRAEPVTVLRAITLAGGTTDRAAERRVKIFRTGPDGARREIVVDLRKVKRGKAEDPVLERDDVILVPETFF